ncbi:phage protein Gp27 family protein, partial [Enterocloster sp.]
AHPDMDYTKAASMVLMDGLMQRVSTAEEDFAEMPLDKAGRLIASLNRAATYEKKVRQDMKKRAELAFEEMETELMAAIRQDPELKDELHGILLRAKEKVLREDG